MTLPQRQRLFHITPDWVETGSVFFITLCCADRTVNSLAKPEVFSVIATATAHYNQTGKWWTRLLLAMPDHLHALASFGPQHPMNKTVCDWKRFVAKSAGISWQDGFFRPSAAQQRIVR